MNTSEKCILILKTNDEKMYEENKEIFDDICKNFDNEDYHIINNDESIHIGLLYYNMASVCEQYYDNLTEKNQELLVYLYSMSGNYGIIYGYRMAGLVSSLNYKYEDAFKYYNYVLEKQNYNINNKYRCLKCNEYRCLKCEDAGDIYMLIASDYNDQNDIQNAIKYYELSILYDNSNDCGLSPIYDLANIYKNQNDYENAKKYFKLSIDREMHSEIIISSLISLCYKYKKYEDYIYFCILYDNIYDTNKHILKLLHKMNSKNNILLEKIEMIILEHNIYYRKNYLGKEINVESHYKFCKKQCEFEYLLKNFIKIPNCIVEIIIEY
jgi:hypothetical protein